MKSVAQTVIEADRFYTIAAHTGNVIQAVEGSKDGGTVRLGKYDHKPEQEWSFVREGDGVYRIRNRASGKLLDLGSRNPVLGLFICLVMLFFFNRYTEKGLKNTAMKALIFTAAYLWCQMLRIDQGICLVVMVSLLWAAREKSNLRAMYGFAAAMICTLFNMYYIGCCLSCIMLHRYNDERGDQNEKLNYAFYPVMLLILGIVGKFIG